ncbi:MAG: PfkB family carbohydrate kinase [Candidatus Omnitrophica bacterium]|nr:PfkB family carbohydrate kinase [Candidatus Omnitrophota bacterium]
MKIDKRVVIVGSVAMDSIETPFGKKDEILGGSATFSSIAASFFNRDNISIVAVVGTDFPEKYIGILKQHQINLDGLEIKEGKTFRWKGSYLKDIHCPVTDYTHLNVFEDFKPKIPQNLKNVPYLFLANIDPELQLNVLNTMVSVKLVLCDTMNYWIHTKPKVLLGFLNKVDMFLLNESEARDLSGEDNLINAAKSLMSKGARSIIIKKGEHGVLYFSKDFTFAAPAVLLDDICDPTGAGDTFAGAFLGYLSNSSKINERNIRKALVYANIMASFTVERFSVNGISNISQDDIDKRYKKFVGITRF